MTRTHKIYISKAINLSILDFKPLHHLFPLRNFVTINLSILDFKLLHILLYTLYITSINLSILDFKQEQISTNGTGTARYKSIHIGF